MSKITKKELRQRCIDNETAIASLESILKENGIERQPQLKQLDQSIFDGLEEKWRFAAVDADGSANGFDIRVYPRGGDEYGLFAYADDYANSDDNSIRLGEGYDASNWQNSLIERDIEKELTGSDLARAMLARGDKYVVCFMSYSNDATAEFHENARIVVAHDDKGFYVHDEYYQYAVPINNQGEPLTQAEVGL